MGLKMEVKNIGIELQKAPLDSKANVKIVKMTGNDNMVPSQIIWVRGEKIKTMV